jgi:hypothetical protein
MTGSLTVYGLRLYGGGILITTAGAFIGAGVDVGSYGVSSGGYAINDEYYGVTGAGVCTRYIGGICTSF